MRIVCLSDTHGKSDKMEHEIPAGDVLIHAGDFTMHGGLSEVEEFCRFLSCLTHIKHKIIIAGNHEVMMDKRYAKDPKINDLVRSMFKANGFIYLEDSFIEIDCIKIWGSPW
jgi:predicted phosphodiesterase